MNPTVNQRQRQIMLFLIEVEDPWENKIFLHLPQENLQEKEDSFGMVETKEKRKITHSSLHDNALIHICKSIYLFVLFY